MSKTYTIPQMRERMAKHLRGLIIKAADDIQDLAKREMFKNQLLGAAHPEPGGHEPAQVGVPDHMEPGAHEQFAVQPPAGPSPEPVASSPIGGGAGIPGGQMDADTCPLCMKPDGPGSCTCLDSLAFGNASLGKNASAGYPQTGAPMAMSEVCKSCGGKGSHLEKCSEGLKPKAGVDPMKKDEVITNNTPDAKAIVPDEGGKKVKASQGSGGKPKENSPLGKGAVPEAKAPSGKIPGGTGAPPMAHNASQPGLGKEELGKAVMSPDMKQHAMIDASKQAAGAAGAKPTAPVGGAPKPLTSPNDMTRANSFSAAAAGEFAPKAPVSSGLDLASKPKAGGVGLQETPMPQGGINLKAPPAAMRGAPGAGAPAPLGAPKPLGAAPKPMGAGPVRNAALPQKPGLLGSLLGKSEKCAFCGTSEHAGECPKT